MGTQHDVGERNNSWRYPVFTFATNESDLKSDVIQHSDLGKINISDSEWDLHCKSIERILSPILKHIHKFAQMQFKGLEIDNSFIRFGSARDGLKVIDALEFDCILAFNIENMQFTTVKARNRYGKEKPGMVKVRVDNADDMMRNLPWLKNSKIIERGNDYLYYLNTKNLQERVFKSVVDKTRQVINDKLSEENSDYNLRRTGKPPTFDIHITLDNDRGINDLYVTFARFTNESRRVVQGEGYQPYNPVLNFDIVPALLIRTDRIPDPYTIKSEFSTFMDCPVYAVMKWAHKSYAALKVPDAEHLWRECTSSYEKAILDTCRRNDSQRYLMTACRILKTYVHNQPGYVQLHAVAASQCLKTICFYCVIFLTIPSGRNRLQGVREALGYFLYCLKLCIENHNLPHFFFGNPYLQEMFPDSSFYGRLFKKNLYSPIHEDTFEHAKRAFDMMLLRLDGLYTDFDNLNLDRIGPFKEHLGLTHQYRHKDIQKRRLCGLKSCTFITVLSAFIIMFLAVLFQRYNGHIIM